MGMQDDEFDGSGASPITFSPPTPVERVEPPNLMMPAVMREIYEWRRRSGMSTASTVGGGSRESVVGNAGDIALDEDLEDDGYEDGESLLDEESRPVGVQKSIRPLQ